MATSIISSLINRSALSANGYALDPNNVTTPFALANGWSASKVNYPAEFSNMFGVLLTVWAFSAGIGTSSGTHMQALLAQNGKVYTRVYENNQWSNWAWLVQ